MAIDVEAEIRDLKRRVGEPEGSFGFLTRQLRAVHKDLLGFQKRTEERFSKMSGRLDKHDGRFDRLEHEVRALRSDLPKIVGTSMREAGDKPRKKR
jgi:hypothetical protein